MEASSSELNKESPALQQGLGGTSKPLRSFGFHVNAAGDLRQGMVGFLLFV